MTEPTLGGQLGLLTKATSLDLRARWHYRQLCRHERLMKRHGHAIRELQPAADTVNQALGT
jgi:hypothetical protein